MGQHSGKQMSQSILVLGSSGKLGRELVHSLVKLNMNVTAGMRDITSQQGQEYLKMGVKVLQLDMNEDHHVLAQKIKGYESVFLNTPGHIDRIKITENAAKAVKEAGASYLLVVSITAVDTDTLFGKQFKEIENYIMNLGISYGIMRLPMFYENLLIQSQSIKNNNVFYGPIDGQIPFVSVSVKDASEAAARVLSYYSQVNNTTFDIVSDKKSLSQWAEELSLLQQGKQIKYSNSGYEEYQKILTGLVKSEWVAEGIIQLFKLAEQQHISQTHVNNVYHQITGNVPTTSLNWIKEHCCEFIGESCEKDHKQSIL